MTTTDRRFTMFTQLLISIIKCKFEMQIYDTLQ